MKLAIVTAIWKRPEVFWIFCRSIYEMAVSTDLELIISIAGSEGSISQELVNTYLKDVPVQTAYVETPNQPLGRKMNSASVLASKYEPDYVLCIGSDDLISPELLQVYQNHMNSGIDYVCLLDLYFYDLATKNALYWAGYNQSNNRGHSVGTGRLVKKWMMDKLDWKLWYDDKYPFWLDTAMNERLATVGEFSETKFKLKDAGVYALDVKSPVNMTPFEPWDNSIFINSKEIEDKFPYLCVV